MRTIARLTAVVAGALVLATASSASAAPMPKPAGPSLAYLRAVTAQYHDMTNLPSSYAGPFMDLNGITCIADPGGMGGMGYHWVDGGAVFDGGVLDPAHPEAYVYAPSNDGTLHLAALEYIVIKADWDATHDSRPELFPGFPFDETPANNRYGLPAFYAQHVWIWDHNPAGMTMMWNPTVHCPAA